MLSDQIVDHWADIKPDRWSDPALGGEWYDAEFESDLITNADAVVASAPDLAERATRAGRSDVVLVPNAVNESVFGGEPSFTAKIFKILFEQYTWWYFDLLIVVLAYFVLI